MTNFYEQRLHEIQNMLHLQIVQQTPWMKEKLETERTHILQELEVEGYARSNL